MPDSPKAVFLSYAREDAEAARRIADALRSQGVEVWVDQNELRGGDAWDAKIRRQIKECSLFLPVISAKTQERGEGYFRLEWKLAVERTHLMAEGVPFLSPVVIDETSDLRAAVPAEFTRVQWTRLPGALPTPQFVEQVKRLLESPRRPVAAHARGERADHPDGRSRRGSPARWIAAIAVVVVALGFMWYRSRAPEAATAAVAKVPAPPASAAPVVSDKSIAVLPFTNMSEEKDSTFFTDGMHEDILTNLALIRELRVVSRTSVMQYRDTKKSIRQIAGELGVAYILEGSVRRAGNKVRVTGQLINARTDEHVWAQNYDRDLTDIFAIQSALAQEIAKALSAALSPQEKDLLTRQPTNNPAAYDLFLKARQIGRDGNDTLAELTLEQSLLESATTLDPSFAGAWVALSEAHAEMLFNFFDTSKARFAKARAAIDMGLKLDPDSPEVIWGAGSFYYYASRDYPRALEYFERLARQSPNNPFGIFACALVERRQGKWVEALAKLRQAEKLDPASPEIARNIAISLRTMRRFDEATVAQELRVRLLPESLRESFELARLKYYATGSTREVDEVMAGPIAAHADEQTRVGYQKLWAATKGDLATALRLEREFPGVWGNVIGGTFGTDNKSWMGAVILAQSGDLAGARASVEKSPAEFRARLVNEPENPAVWAALAQTEALLGHQEEALAAARRSKELMSRSVDSLSWGFTNLTMAYVYTVGGDKAHAIAELQELFDSTGTSNVHMLKTGIWFAPLKDDPRFQAMVNDPKNNAPLF